MDFGIFYEIQVNSPLKHREREAEGFHQVLDQVALAEEGARCGKNRHARYRSSNGRVEVGTGRSGTIQELGGFGIPPEETRARWEEGLRILVDVWKSQDGTFSWKGRYFDIRAK